MKAIIALGNPGAKYEFTRHNFGWLVADRIEDSITVTGRKKTPSYTLVSGKSSGKPLLICRPQVFMNRSGISVENFLRDEKLELEDVVVVYDDIDILFGHMKLRSGGGDGGHKGIRSILREIGNADFLRMRMGIRQQDMLAGTSEFVLSAFNEEETQALDALIEKAAKALLDLLRLEAKLVMNYVNRKE